MDATKPHKPHCLLVPFPVQGHINPILQFSKKLKQKGITVTLATTCFVFNTAHEISELITVETISDGFDEGGLAQAEDFGTYQKKFKEIGSKALRQVVEKLSGLGNPIDCLIYDPSLPWVLDVAKCFGLVGAVFFTQSCAVGNIYYQVYSRSLKLPLENSEISILGLPLLETFDMPSFVTEPGSYPGLFDTKVNQFLNMDKTDWVLCNTFYKLEKEVVDVMGKQWRLRTIGPTIPSFYLDRKLYHDKDYGLSVYKPNTGACILWLDDQEKGSVIYVSFGSLAELGGEQMEELAQGLIKSNKHFLWVVRASEQAKLPKSIVEETLANGLVVSWCPQLDVLAHEAIGCFITHCGWNSTLEALSLGIPMVGMPQWTDQPINSKYISDVWKIGVRARPDEKGIVRRQMIEHCIGQVMDGERSKEFTNNAIKWRDSAREATNEGGCSDKNIEEFVAYLQARISN